MAAPVLQTWSQDENVGTSTTITKPTGTTEDDLLIFAACLDKSANLITGYPSGFSTNIIYEEAFEGQGYLFVAWKIAGGSEPATYTLGSTSNEQVNVAVLRIDGHDASSPVDVYGKTEQTTTAVSCPVVTTTVDDALLLRIPCTDGNKFTEDTGYPSGTNGEFWKHVGLAAGLGVAWENQASSGASASRSWSLTGSDESAGITLAIAPAAGGGVTLTVQDATHAHAADNVGLIQANTLSVAESTHSHTVDNLDLDVSVILDVSDAAHAHAADNVDLVQANILSVLDAVHAHAADNIDLVTEITLIVSDTLHAHAADNIDLSLPGGAVTPDGRIIAIPMQDRTIIITTQDRVFTIN